jgi:hypothetical protein
MEVDQIAEFLGETTVVPARLSPFERDVVVQLLQAQLNVNVEASMPWNAADAPDGIQNVSGWELIPTFVGDLPCLVFSPLATAVWRFADGPELLKFLRETPHFEFYVCDAEATYLICFNHHDFILGWGRSTTWVKQLKNS